MLLELKKLIEANPLFRDKLAFPSLKASRLRTLINQRYHEQFWSMLAVISQMPVDMCKILCTNDSSQRLCNQWVLRNCRQYHKSAVWLPTAPNYVHYNGLSCSLNWQHQLCKNPRPNPDIKTLFIDHTCGPPNGARAPPPANNPLVGGLPKQGAFPPLGAHSVSSHCCHKWSAHSFTPCFLCKLGESLKWEVQYLEGYVVQENNFH